MNTQIKTINDYIRNHEPDDITRLRKQAERIRANKALAARNLYNTYERDRLRREIKEAGENPCC